MYARGPITPSLSSMVISNDLLPTSCTHLLLVWMLTLAFLARVAAQGSPCRNAAGTDVAIVVDTLVPVTVGAPGGERAVRGGELSATACRAWWLITTFFVCNLGYLDIDKNSATYCRQRTCS